MAAAIFALAGTLLGVLGLSPCNSLRHALTMFAPAGKRFGWPAASKPSRRWKITESKLGTCRALLVVKSDSAAHFYLLYNPVLSISFTPAHQSVVHGCKSVKTVVNDSGNTNYIFARTKATSSKQQTLTLVQAAGGR